MKIPVRPVQGGLNLTPLIDIVFLLLVFFLLTTHFIEEEGIAVKLPTAASKAEHDAKEISVALTRDGTPYLDGAAVAPGELAGRLRERIRRPDTTVVIRGDRDVNLQACVSVMEAAKSAGAARIIVATLSQGGGT